MQANSPVGGWRRRGTDYNWMLLAGGPLIGIRRAVARRRRPSRIVQAAGWI